MKSNEKYEQLCSQAIRDMAFTSAEQMANVQWWIEYDATCDINGFGIQNRRRSIRFSECSGKDLYNETQDFRFT